MNITMNQHHKAILDHLRPIKGVEIAGSFEIQIGKRVYPAVRYRQTMQTPPGTPAFQRGEREYVEDRFYVAGALPPSYLRNPGSSRSYGIRYKLGDESGEWYVIAHSDGASLTEEQKRYHPQLEDGRAFETFLLGSWNPAHYVGSARPRVMRCALRVAHERPECGGAVR